MRDDFMILQILTIATCPGQELFPDSDYFLSRGEFLEGVTLEGLPGRELVRGL